VALVSETSLRQVQVDEEVEAPAPLDTEKAKSVEESRYLVAHQANLRQAQAANEMGQV
jgi:hypothetical protein|tara:strand:+ start:716 stop:889 length:174 start_codon:yes stop_codon:yes gene_type:complete